MAIEWSDFNKFEPVNDKYLPARGEGDNKATQVCTAVNKIVYKWFNDGDVYDNTYNLKGWWNDISSFANWLLQYAGAEILYRISTIKTEQEYTDMLFELCEKYLTPEYLDAAAGMPAEGSVYKCAGPFVYEEETEEEEEDWF